MTNTTELPQLQWLADEFSMVLHEWLTPIEFYNVIHRNKLQADPAICHSHDFCDANMAMEEAWNRWPGGPDLDPSNQAHVDIINESWKLAKAAGFHQGATSCE